jgi:hypothetical protein
MEVQMKCDHIMTTKSWWCASGLLFSVIMTYMIYRLGLPGAFILDDFDSLAGIAHLGSADDLPGLLRYLFGNDGTSWSRSVAYLSFLVDDQVWPSSPQPFKTTNIALHLVNGLLACLLLFRVLRYRLSTESAFAVAVVAAALWLIHPLQVSTVLYVVQRMSQLSMLFVVLVLLCHCYALESKRPCAGISWVLLAAVCGLLGVLSKENALVGIWLMALISWFARLNHTQYPGMAKLRSCYIGVIYIVAAACLIYFVYTALDRGFGFRVFDQNERMAFQGLVLAKYLQYWFFPWGADMGLFHDDMEYRIQQASAAFYATWWILHLVIIGVACKFWRKLPLVTFGVFFFYLGHIIESTIWPLELMYEHRNYLPSLGLSLVTVEVMRWLIDFCRSRKLPVLGYGVAVLFIGALATQLVYRVSIWSDYKMMISKWAYEHPYSLRAQTSMATLLSSAGMTAMASDKLSETDLHLPNLVVRLQRLNLQCSQSVSQEDKVNLTRQEVIASPFSAGTLHQVEAAVKSQRVECFEKNFEDFDFYWLLEQIGSKKDLRSHGNYLTQFNDVASDFYISRFDYTSALMARLEMYQRQPTIDTALKLADLYLLGGDAEGAKEYLDKARVRNEQRWYRDPSRDAQIRNLEIGLSLLINNQSKNES